MLRNIVGVVVGYLAIVVVVFTVFTLAYLGMGTERAFRPGSFEVSTLWVSMALVVNLLAAIGGGLVAAVIGRSSKAPRALAGLVLVLGVLAAIPVLLPPAEKTPTERTSALSNLEAMAQARQPAWFAATAPVVGVLGVLVGASLRQSAQA
jgi:hypothetical protein